MLKMADSHRVLVAVVKTMFNVSSMELAEKRVRPRLRVVDVQVYHWLDSLSGLVIGCMLVFSPWAWGTTEEWSIAVMNSAGYGLGGMLALKLAIRKFRGYQPPRWETFDDSWRTRTLAWLTLFILAYCLFSAVNARANWRPETSQLEYCRFVAWLPHSLDGHSSWLAFGRYLGLAASYWAIRDWLLGKSVGEIRTEDLSTPLPRRVMHLLTVVMVSGTVLAIESILQRELNSPKLLFLIQPRIHVTASAQWGPFAYRANGAQYFNLLWPVCLGCWSSLHIRAKGTIIRHHSWLLAAALLAACPLMASSRGGALIAFSLLLSTVACFGWHYWSSAGAAPARHSRLAATWPLIVYLVLVLCTGFGLGWKSLQPRLADWKRGYAEREAAYQYAAQIAADYPVFGTGPGTYESVSELYRPLTGEFWPAQLHNDWLETRITFGWLGSGLLWLALSVAIFPRLGGRERRPKSNLGTMIQLALMGCLLHSRWDFPFQVHSILFLFLVWCAVLTALHRRTLTSGGISQPRRSASSRSAPALVKV